MTAFTPEELNRLREAVKLRAEQIARRKREIDVLRRAAWQRIDLLREDGVLPPALAAEPREHVQLYPPPAVQEKRPGAGEPVSAPPAGTTAAATRDAALELAANEALAPAR